jgi:hypothetical protein
MHAAVDRAARVAAHAQAERDVPADVAVVEERVVLEHEPDAAAVGRDGREVDAVQEHPARVGSLETGDHPEQRALPRSTRPEHGDDLAVPDLERDAGERRLPAEPHAHVLDGEHQSHPPSRRGRTRSTTRTDVTVTAIRITASA